MSEFPVYVFYDYFRDEIYTVEHGYAIEECRVIALETEAIYLGEL